MDVLVESAAEARVPASPPFSTTVAAVPEVDYTELKRTPHGLHLEAFHCSDFIGVVLAVMLTVLVLDGFESPWSTIGFLQTFELFLVFPGLVVLCCSKMRLYRRFPDLANTRDVLALFKAVGLAALILCTMFYIQGQGLLPGVTGSLVISTLSLLLAWRCFAQFRIARLVAAGGMGTNVLIIGAGKRGSDLASYIRSNRHLGYVVKGFLDDTYHGPEILGSTRDLPRIARNEYIDEIFITSRANMMEAQKLVARARSLCLDVTIVPDSNEFAGIGPMGFVGDFPIVELHREPIPTLGLLAKRVIDVVFVILTAVVSVPLIIFLGILIRLDSPGPIFYACKRVGRKGRVFDFYKLRSMVSNAEALRDELEVFNERDGVLFKMSNDPRVTRLGRFLRKYSLDELPQLLNVLKGDMSLVGPRPPLLSEFKKYQAAHKRRLDVSPGITGLWQVSGRKDPSFDEYLALDLRYIENWNLFLDLEILLRTIPAVLRGTGN